MRRVLLHIGFNKTGTTSIQYWLRDHEELLAAHRVRFPRGWLQLNNHFELPLTLLRLDRMIPARAHGDEWRDPAWRVDVWRQVHDDLERHPDELTVLSAEYLSCMRYDDEVANLRRIVGDAVVIAYYRRPADFLASLAAHYTKPGGPGLSHDPDAFNYVGPGAWRADYQPLLSLWARHFRFLYVMDYDACTAHDGSVIPSFLHVLDVPVTADVPDYMLNRREDRTILRVDGNRAHGLPFGAPLLEAPAGGPREAPAAQAVSGP